MSLGPHLVEVFLPLVADDFLLVQCCEVLVEAAFLIRLLLKLILCTVRNEAINGNRFHVPSPPRSGEKVAGGRMRGLTGLLSNEAEDQI